MARVIDAIELHRKKPGMLVSHHAWLPQGPPRDLIVAMDDATSAIPVLVENLPPMPSLN